MQLFQLLGHKKMLAHSWKENTFSGIPAFLQSVSVSSLSHLSLLSSCLVPSPVALPQFLLSSALPLSRKLFNLPWIPHSSYPILSYPILLKSPGSSQLQYSDTKYVLAAVRGAYLLSETLLQCDSQTCVGHRNHMMENLLVPVSKENR
jgi:hypothetical protein